MESDETIFWSILYMLSMFAAAVSMVWWLYLYTAQCDISSVVAYVN